MTKYSSMAMGNELIALNTIDIRKSFFGLKKEAFYLPTNSIIEGYDFFLAPDSVSLVREMMNAAKPETIISLADRGMKVTHHANGNERLDVCQSKDKQFIALQCFKYEHYMYRKTTDVKIFEGEAAQKVSEMLGL